MIFASTKKVVTVNGRHLFFCRETYTVLEIGGYGGYNNAQIQITQKIIHEGEVNRARYQYENPNVIATKSRSGEVYVFDRTTHASFPKEDEPFSPDLRLMGHSKEG